MNQHLRELLINQIKKALADSRTASLKKHPYLIGKVREILLDSLIAPLLSNNYSSSSGHVIDYNGNQSNEMDICIYSKNLLPAFFYTQKENLGMFPIESVLSCIEVKTSFNKTNLKDAFDKFQHLMTNIKMTACFHDDNGMPLAHVYIKPKCSFFAFATDTNKYTPEYILSVYKEIDPDWEENPLITSICIAGKGWMCNTLRGWYHMGYDKKTKVNEEIIGYLCALLHDTDLTIKGRGIPRIGYYLSNAYQMDKIENGKKIRNTWRNKKLEFSDTDLDKAKTYTATIL